MPDKHPNTERWGGPGASHEDASKPQPPKVDPRAPGEPTNTRHSHVSGGGGERDIHHARNPEAKSDFEENSTERAKP
ncbi:hypothetical protein ABOZ73_14235 [Caulobacter sp. 73W]|uniref:Uncharacterized protein n=1 Tax=Caulobacter sp. 73W TaxID=3161137 RepID=A0AB39KQR4_9CAUL|nr:hypothetical protein [Caulobacter segnis]MDG2523569.1 hypothetical protein [Caulobacter segnis]